MERQKLHHKTNTLEGNAVLMSLLVGHGRIAVLLLYAVKNEEITTTLYNIR